MLVAVQESDTPDEELQENVELQAVKSKKKTSQSTVQSNEEDQPSTSK